MRIFALSDLHLAISADKPMDIFGPSWENYIPKLKENWKNTITNDDLVLIAGDLSWAMKIEEFEKDLEFFNDLPGFKLFIKGNHDLWWKSVSAVRNLLPKNMFCLQYDSVRFDEGFVICGTRGWDLPNDEFTEHDHYMYNKEILRLEMALSNAKSKMQEGDKLIVMMHYPPYSKTNKNNPFLDLINSYNVDAVVFGHIHTEFVLPIKEKIENTDFYLTSCDILKNMPIEIKL